MRNKLSTIPKINIHVNSLTNQWFLKISTLVLFTGKFLFFLMAKRIVSNIVCSYGFTVCINNDHNVVSFGMSQKGAHGHEAEEVFPPKIISSLNHIISISAGDNHCVCLDNDGNVFTFGRDDGQLGIDNDDLVYTSIPQKVNLPPCKQISCGDNNTICLSENGEVYSFGYNDDGQLGLGNNESYNSPQLTSSFDNDEHNIGVF